MVLLSINYEMNDLSQNSYSPHLLSDDIKSGISSDIIFLFSLSCLFYLLSFQNIFLKLPLAFHNLLRNR